MLKQTCYRNRDVLIITIRRVNNKNKNDGETETC